MKLSLMWLREHLDHPQGPDFFLDQVKEIVHRLVRSTAEIEQVEHLSIDVQRLFLGRLKETVNDNVILHVPELSNNASNTLLTLPSRSDAGPFLEAPWYMIYQESSLQYRYATISDVTYKWTGSTEPANLALKDSLLPVFYISDSEGSGKWKNRCDLYDVRITIENKSINHRPDLWSHRGFAREVAALMGWQLKPIPETLCTSIAPALASELNVYSDTCDRFARLDLDVIAKGSFPWMALRLLLLDHKPISAIVDATNYTMFDMGQPLHAFDRATLQGNLGVRQAREGEKLTLLDNVTLELHPSDCVVADEKKALSLAGIKGGLGSGISRKTTSIVLEAAHFLPIPIRRSATQHRIRTESSTRFEKGLDPLTVTDGIQKFLSILFHEKIIVEQSYVIKLWRESLHSKLSVIQLPCAYVVRKLGIEIPEHEVCAILTSLGFTLSLGEVADGRCYLVQVPSWRINDIVLAEDLIEEIARTRGYDSIPAILPQRAMQLVGNKKVHIIRAIRHHLAYGLRMQEVMSYPFFDEEFLQKAQLTVHKAAIVRNPVSDQWRRLVTSLIPNLVSQLTANLPEAKEVRLFEIAATWEHDGTTVSEGRKVSWIWYLHKELDFYTGKQMVTSLLDMLRIQNSWDIAVEELPCWWHRSSTAIVSHEQKKIGYAGMLNPLFLNHVLDGHCFAVELDFDFLQDYVPKQILYHPISKYPTIVSDISMFLSNRIPVERLMEAIPAIDEHIMQVYLIDFFEKKEWSDRRSVTIRVVCGDQLRTMTHDEVNEIIARVISLLTVQFKVELR
jgi:phenylalanyl-tRNA synthetase beta chain